MLMTLLAFVVALGVLIAVHEYGHYRMAVACGIKVLKFSIGFGKPIFTWRLKGKPTEFVIGMLPLGGYVRMLDEREGAVDPVERHLAFNNQPLRARAAVVAAGPIANLLLAILLFASVNWVGMQEPQALLASPVPGSVAERAGLRGQELVLQAGYVGEPMTALKSFDDLRWRLMQGALGSRDMRLGLASDKVAAAALSGDVIADATDLAGAQTSREVVLKLSGLSTGEADATMFRKIGITSPWTAPVIGEIQAGSAAEKSGLQSGDVVRSIGGSAVVDAQQLRERIRSNLQPDGNPMTQTWQLLRNGQALALDVTPALLTVENISVGRIGAFVGAPPQFVTVRYGPLDGVWQGAVRTWQVSVLSLKMMGKMIIGEASLKNLSGPLTIADYAGKSASQGWSAYIVFLALISVSLGVLNLLPLPVLDGGHLMYYLWEGVTGRSVSAAWMDKLQRGGVAILLMMMSIAMFNDVVRLFG
jgi:regulator of sigma E protease